MVLPQLKDTATSAIFTPQSQKKVTVTDASTVTPQRKSMNEASQTPPEVASSYFNWSKLRDFSERNLAALRDSEPSYVVGTLTVITAMIYVVLKKLESPAISISPTPGKPFIESGSSKPPVNRYLAKNNPHAKKAADSPPPARKSFFSSFMKLFSVGTANEYDDLDKIREQNAAKKSKTEFKDFKGGEREHSKYGIYVKNLRGEHE